MGSKKGVLVDNEVRFEEALAIRVGRYLIEKGFYPANSHGVALSSLREDDSLGILLQQETKKRFLGFLRPAPRRLFVGVLSLRHRDRWTIEVQGRPVVEAIKRLAELMAADFGVKIDLRLVSESVSREYYPRDDL